MANGVFGADPELLHNSGGKFDQIASDFTKNYQKIYSLIDEMVTNNFLSPDAYQIAANIYSYADELVRVAKIMHNYSSFCVTGGNVVYQNQDDVVASLKTDVGGEYRG